MDVKKFNQTIEILCKEKGIAKDVIFDALELALTSAYKKNFKSLSNVRVEINRELGAIKVFSFRTVVVDEFKEAYEPIILVVEDEDSDDPEATIEIEKPYIYDARIHITLEDALCEVEGIEVGETIEKEVTPIDFGRVAAATAKQVVIQKIKEAEKNIIIEEFTNKQDELISGLVAMEDVRNYYIDLGRTQGILPKSEIIPGETVKMGSSIKVYVTKVESTTKGPLILLSRTHYGFVKRLFELEIPEINDGTITVHSVAREAGVRCKVSVSSSVSNVDPVGACIGERGSRIANILKTLGREKVDVVEFNEDRAIYIANALAPAREVTVIMNDDNTALVVADIENLSLAIGKSGINVKLASRLTRCRLDIKNKEQASALGINII